MRKRLQHPYPNKWQRAACKQTTRYISVFYPKISGIYLFAVLLFDKAVGVAQVVVHHFILAGLDGDVGAFE